MTEIMDLKKLKKKKKTAISITINSENLDFLKEDMKREGVADMPLSLVFDNLLADFVNYRKLQFKIEEQKNLKGKSGEDEHTNKKEQ
ncbi:MAG: hypothetical protein WC533_00825 [Candidatus Pacearchaeota archaeon]